MFGRLCLKHSKGEPHQALLSVGHRCDVVHVKSRMLKQQLEQLTFLLPLDVSGVTSGYVYLLQDLIVVGKPRSAE